MADLPNNTDEAKGRLKEAAGSVTGNDDLENEGTVDRITGSIKETVDNVADKAKELFGKGDDN